jgi:glycosyltransferase involved in cell wall biosynthesis
VIRRLVHVSDAWITSCTKYADQLVNEFSASRELGARIPIAANVPAATELSEDRLWSLDFGRKLRIAVFGLPNTRLTALRRHGRLLRALVSAGLVDSMLLIGKSDHSPRYLQRLAEQQRQIGGVWRSFFDLPPMQVAETLADCDVGLVANEPDTLTKSGVFAALSTNGVVAIVASSGNAPVPGPFNDCVLLNDEQAGVDAIVAELRGTNRMTARRRATLRAARAELSWDRVAMAFRDAMAMAKSPSRTDHAQQVAVPAMGALGEREVRA